VARTGELEGVILLNRDSPTELVIELSERFNDLSEIRVYCHSWRNQTESLRLVYGEEYIVEENQIGEFYNSLWGALSIDPVPGMEVIIGYTRLYNFESNDWTGEPEYTYIYPKELRCQHGITINSDERLHCRSKAKLHEDQSLFGTIPVSRKVRNKICPPRYCQYKSKIVSNQSDRVVFVPRHLCKSHSFCSDLCKDEWYEDTYQERSDFNHANADGWR
jgi:hypothetical protein